MEPTINESSSRQISATGPRTEMGKRRTRQNATRHGLFARCFLASEAFQESACDYKRLLNELRDVERPADVVEELILEELAFVYIRMIHVYLEEMKLAPQIFMQLGRGVSDDPVELRTQWIDRQKVVVFPDRSLRPDLLLRYANSASRQIDRLWTRLEVYRRVRQLTPLPPIALNKS